MKYTYNKASGYDVAYDSKRGYVVTKHQLLMEKKLGRRLRPGERVHHKDGIKSNSCLRNLKLTKNQSMHNKEHKVWKGKNNPSVTMGHAAKSRLVKKAWRTRRLNK